MNVRTNDEDEQADDLFLAVIYKYLGLVVGIPFVVAGSQYRSPGRTLMQFSMAKI
jgi:hypothetical protein